MAAPPAAPAHRFLDRGLARLLEAAGGDRDGAASDDHLRQPEVERGFAEGPSGLRGALDSAVNDVPAGTATTPSATRLYSSLVVKLAPGALWEETLSIMRTRNVVP